jgi:4-hydroxy-3-methylbut-2-enyl diphosphate reductase
MAVITLAPAAGFCFGVGRAVSICERLAASGVKTVTLGEIIHNASVVSELERKGVGVVSSPLETPDGATLVIRSHGVPRSVYELCAGRGIEIADATCPVVAAIHGIVARYGERGYTVLVAGDAGHPEVEGIAGHCRGPVFVFGDAQELNSLTGAQIAGAPCIMVAQTTFNVVKYAECSDYAKNLYTNLTVFDTICSATRERQSEAEELARGSDLCVVIGGRNSSNTKKLYEVCLRHTRTCRIETKDELTADMLRGAEKIGVTAGASTPTPIIQEVLDKMSDMIRDEEFNFEEALEESLKMVHRGQRVEGVVTSIRPNEVVVDIGTKQTGFIPLDELSDDASVKPEDIVKVGDKIRLVVTKVRDLEGYVTLSKKRLDSETGISDLAKGVEDGTVFDAYISEAVNKGLVAIVKGVRVFIPASQATLRRGEPYEQLAKTNQKIKILEVSPERRRAIGSIRAVLDIDAEKKRGEFWSSIETGKRYRGTVKSITSYGVFVDLGAVDGMIHKSELSWERVSKPQDVVQIGDEVEVYIKEFNPETRKISLGYRDEAENPWNLVKNYEIGSEFEAPVVSVTAFGAFVRILPGVDGLVHTSEMPGGHASPGEAVKVGDVVKVRLIGVNMEKKRISLSMRPEGIETDAPAAEPAQAPEEAENAAE